MPDTNTLQIQAQLFSTPKGYEILFIHPGTVNGWTFGEAVLQESASLWDGIELFVDHGAEKHSARDLGGVLATARWNDEHGGLSATLKPTGPARQIVSDACLAILAGDTKTLGFSADVVFEHQDGIVTRIIRPISLDLVWNPAFNTKVIRQLNQKGAPMTDKTERPDHPGSPTDEELLEAHREIQRQRAEREQDQARLQAQAEADSTRSARVPSPLKIA